MPASRRTILFRSAGAFAGIIATALIAGVVVGYLTASGVDINLGAIGFWVLGAVALMVMAGSIWLGAVWMRSIDEAAREAHKSAWYWGGSSGMAVGGVLMIMSSLPGAEVLSIPTWLAGRADPAAYAATGAFMLMGLMLVGYGIAWAFWWLQRR